MTWLMTQAYSATTTMTDDAGAWTTALYVSTALFLTSALALYLKYSKAQESGPGAKAGKAAEDEKKTTVSVLFGTQTGTAERFANQLSEEISEKYPTVAAKALDIETYNHKDKLAKEDLALFCVATYGDGEPTDSALSFTEWLEALRKKGDEDGSAPLDGLKYGVFALGNKQYEHFCACGKLVDKQLKALGADPVVRRGEGDDDANIEEDFEAWKEVLWTELDKLFAKLNGSVNGTNGVPVTTIMSAKILNEYKVETLKDSSAASANLWKTDSVEIGPNSPIKAKIVERRELHTKRSERSCIHAEIDISEISGLSYQTGDHVAIFAPNPPELVSECLKRLACDGKEVVRLVPKLGSGMKRTAFEGKALTIRDLVSNFLDIQSPPRKEALSAMASCAEDPKEKARLSTLASREGREEYKAYVLDDLRSLVEVLDDHTSVKPSLGVFAARIATKLQPRFYSISSSNLSHPGAIHVTCALVQGQSPTGRHHKGVASTWLSRAKAGASSAAIFVRKSNFKMPADPLSPIIMVGPGTGLAPFRGFLQEREARQKMGEAAMGPAHLYFGCRSKDKDFIYEDEIKSYVASGVITNLDLAFSRDQDHKIYVQDKIRANGKACYDVLFDSAKPKGYFYVCGDKEMAKDVNKALHEIIQTHGSRTASEAEWMIKNLQESGRYLRDVW